MNWLGAAGAIGETLGRILHRHDALTPERVATALYRGILEREPDIPGLTEQVEALRHTNTLEHAIRVLIASPEFRARFLKSLLDPGPLPDLTLTIPERYQVQDANGKAMRVYLAENQEHMNCMSSLIERHRFYDRFGVWNPGIDHDKEITAGIVRGLEARSCFELGCFTGPVLSLLVDAGVEVCGAEVSHLAFAFAYAKAREAMLFGDLLELRINRCFDVVLCMDVLEHINPLRLDAYIAKCVSLLNNDGYLYLNSPMWGEDPVFGLFEEIYLAEWREVGDASYWKHWPSDELGWPIHGHLVWASPGWWTQKFAEHGLMRDIVVERAIHRRLSGFFEQANGRRSLFVLRRPASSRDSDTVAATLDATLAAMPGIPRK